MSDQTTPVPAPTAPEAEYGSTYYSNYWGGGGPYERNERWLAFFNGVAEQLVRDFHPATALDAGCAMGFLVEGLRNQGVDASGVDVSEYAISQVHESVAPYCSVASLSEPLPGRYDLVTCIEVLEHIPPSETDAAITSLCAATDTLLISTTPEDFGEPTHLNVQPPEYWSAKLAQHGFMRDLDRDLSYLSPWAGAYVRREEPREETVRRYDRSWYRLRREAAEVRKSLLDVQNQLAELESRGGVADPAGLEAELQRSRTEVLRLRDMLIGKDVELGAAQGRAAELEERWLRITNAASRVPGLNALKKLARRG